ncbi:hypothetical protein FJY70_01020, partial [candidate division WOR-3 bacterium]|nr:hypothetical protein [candidate division WOR-3 bacterium]
MTRTLLIAAAGLLVWAGCARKQPDYFPLVRGAQRVMRVRQRVVVAGATSETTCVAVVEAVRGEVEVPQMGKVWVVDAPADSARFFYRRSG